MNSDEMNYSGVLTETINTLNVDLQSFEVDTGIEALSDVLSMLLASHRMISDEREKEYLRRMIWYTVNKVIENTVGVKYIPGLIDEVSRTLERKLWDIESIDVDLIRNIVMKTIIYSRNRVDPGDYELNEYRFLIKELMFEMGYNGGSVLIENIINQGGLEDLISLTVVVLALSTNI